ncbi:unnamed protein product [Sphagnum jensenii]
MEIAALTRDSRGATTEDTTAALFVVTKCTVRGLHKNHPEAEVQEFHLVYSCLHSASYNGGYCANEMADSRDSSFQHGQVKDARFLHRNGSMSSGVHEEIGVLFGKADILALGASTSH